MNDPATLVAPDAVHEPLPSWLPSSLRVDDPGIAAAVLLQSTIAREAILGLVDMLRTGGRVQPTQRARTAALFTELLANAERIKTVAEFATQMEGGAHV